jgi:hypothetical protein
MYPSAFSRCLVSIDSRSGKTFLIRKIMYSVALRYPEPSKVFTSLSYRGLGIGMLTYSTARSPPCLWYDVYRYYVYRFFVVDTSLT